MAVISIWSVKGGVGKTSLAANLAWCAARLARQDTLLWDLDASGGAGFLLDTQPAKKQAVAQILSDKGDLSACVRTTDYERLHVLPADESLRGLESGLLSIGKRKRFAKLADRLSQDYSRIVIDCPPALDEVSAQVIRASDLIIVPLPPSPLSSRALDLVVDQVKAQPKPRPPVLPLLSMLDMRRTLHRNAREEHPDWPAIPYASAVEQCAVRQLPLGEFAPSSPPSRAMMMLWHRIEQKLAELES